jgi:glycosyltransferase involved in cell wall biosynthesis
MKKNISLFFQHVPPFAGAGSRRAKSIIEGLGKSSDEVNLKLYTTVEKNKLKEIDKTVVISGLSEGNKSNYLFRLIKEILIGFKVGFRIIFKYYKPDLLIISSPSYFGFLVIGFLAKFRKVTYALEIRDIYPEVFYYSGLLKKFKIVYKILDFMTINVYKSAAIIVCSNKLIEKNINVKVPNVKTETVFNGFPDNLIDLSENKFDKFTICFHGVLGVFQDVNTLKNVITKLKYLNINIIAIGYGPKENLLKDIKQDNFKFLGRKTLNETIVIISKCHLGLSLRTKEYISLNCFPVKNWEYLGAAIPSINTPQNEAALFCSEYEIGQSLESGDVDMIINHINKYVNDKDFYELQSNNCRIIRDKYSRSNTGDLAAKIFLNIIK